LVRNRLVEIDLVAAKVALCAVPVHPLVC